MCNNLPYCVSVQGFEEIVKPERNRSQGPMQLIGELDEEKVVALEQNNDFKQGSRLEDRRLIKIGHFIFGSFIFILAGGTVEKIR